MSPDDVPQVAWRPWSRATFDLARRERRPVLINVSARWCHWCHVMDERTFADPAVARLLSTRFVAVRVDADERPDLAERYAEWGWPANAILTPDAEPVTERRGFQEPDAFLGLLQQVARQQRDGTLQGRLDPPPPRPQRQDLARLRDAVQARLDAVYDPAQGGWGRFQKYPFAAPVEQAFLRRHRDPAALARALQTLRGTLQLLDPVWGGAFQYSVDDRWDAPHFEKIAVVNAGVLDNLAQAYAVTGDRSWLRAARQVRDYVATFLTNPDGSFATSQDADVQGRHGTVPGQQYYSRGARARRRLGTPHTDRNAYADWNGLLIAALCRLHDASGDRKALAMAGRAAQAVLASHRRGAAFTHAAHDASPVVHLRDNAAMGRALLALDRSLGGDGHAAAIEDAAATVLGLEAAGGGFQAHGADPDAAGALARPRRPLEENGLAMRFLCELAWTWPEHPMAAPGRAAAERAARALAHPRLVAAEGRIIGTFLLGLEALLAEPTRLEVAGKTDSRAWRRLHAACLRQGGFAHVVRAVAPRPVSPAVYACQGSSCSQPLRSVAALRRAMAHG